MLALHALPVDEGVVAADLDQHVAVATVPDPAQHTLTGQRQRELALVFAAQPDLRQWRSVGGAQGHRRAKPGPARSKRRRRGGVQNHAQTRLIQSGTRLTGGW